MPSCCARACTRGSGTTARASAGRCACPAGQLDAKATAHLWPAAAPSVCGQCLPRASLGAQVPRIGRQLGERLAGAGIASLQALRQADARRIEAITQQKYPFGVPCGATGLVLCAQRPALRPSFLPSAGTHVQESLKRMLPPAVKLDLDAQAGGCSAFRKLPALAPCSHSLKLQAIKSLLSDSEAYAAAS